MKPGVSSFSQIYWREQGEGWYRFFHFGIGIGYTPLPLIYWNHRFRRKLQSNLWGSMPCGQNLDFK